MPLLNDQDGAKADKRERDSASRDSLNRVELALIQRGESMQPRGREIREIHQERATCGNLACRSGWTFPWKGRNHPIFEDKWACTTKCLLAMVQAAISREVGDGQREGVDLRHRHRVPLGLLLLAQGWITQPQLQKALEAQRAHGEGQSGAKIGDWLVSQCGLGPEMVTRGLSVQWQCPVLTTEGFSPAAMALALPKAFIERFGVLPLRIAGSKILYVVFQDHLDASSAFAAERMSGLRTESGLVVEERFREARERLLGCRFVPVTECRVRDRDMLAKAMTTVIENKSTAASRLVRLRQYYWLRTWSATGRHRPCGNVPTNADDAADYLFTIGKGD